MEDQVPYLTSLTAGLGGVLLITAVRMGVPAPHVVGAHYWQVGMKVLAAFVAFSDTTPVLDSSLPASEGLKSRLPTGLCWHE